MAEQVGATPRSTPQFGFPRRLAGPEPWAEARTLAEEALDRVSEAAIVTDRRGAIQRVNRAFTQMTGYGADAVRGRRLRPFVLGGADRAAFVALRQALLAAGRWTGEALNRRKNGESYPARLEIGAVHDKAGRVIHYICVMSDISRQRHDADLIEQMRSFDPLTGLPNWELLQRRLRAALAAAQSGERQVAVLQVNLDRFKGLNDTLGNAHGDYIIAIIAERLVRCVGEGNTVARRGSDEFCVLLPSIAGAEGAAAVGQRILAVVAEPLRIFEHEYVLTASIGISRFPGDGDTASALLTQASAATHLAKSEGRNNYQFFNGKLSAMMQERLAISKGLRQAVERSELLLHYQPQVSLLSGQVVGVEALIRWRHPEMGMISPLRFIPLAEETGEIVAIGEWVLQAACRQGRLWHDAGHVDLSMAVNLSPRQFAQAGLAGRVEIILAESGFAADALELEITEGILMADPAMAAGVLAGLKGLGISFSVDDFGTGYSSLGYLKRFPLDRLKIDRSFVSDCCVNRHDGAIVAAVIGLARALDLEVVAEGVETMSQLDFLHRHGCGFVQGYLFSPPLPARQMTALLADGASRPAARMEASA